MLPTQNTAELCSLALGADYQGQVQLARWMISLVRIVCVSMCVHARMFMCMNVCVCMHLAICVGVHVC